MGLESAQRWRVDWSGCELVEVIPGKVSGVPLIRHTRVPVDLVVASRDGGETVDEIAYNYDLKSEDIQAVLLFAAPIQINRVDVAVGSIEYELKGHDAL